MTPTTLGITHSACEVCRTLVPARVEAGADGVWLRKFCTAHGEQRHRVWSDVDSYLQTLRFVKPAQQPRAFHGDAAKPCPEGCGFCARHEQHLCMPIIEITSRCDLTCPVCLVNAAAGRGADMRLADFAHILDNLLAAETQVDVLNLSGGEPLLHPELPAFLDEIRRRPQIVRTSISTNGLALLRDPALLPLLKARNVVVSLQFDGFEDAVYERLRGRPLAAEKRAILELLAAQNVTASLTLTLAAGVNDAQLRPVLDLFFGTPHLVSLMLQPLAFAGRAAELTPALPRLTIPEVIQRLAAAGHPAVKAADFTPLPCSHPLCFSLAFYLITQGGAAVSVNQLVGADTVMDALANKVLYGLDPAEHARLRDLIYELWSGPAAAAPDAPRVLDTLRVILRDLSGCAFDPQLFMAKTERRVKSIFIHAFQDAATFDLARVRRCCQAYPQPDGRLLPACVRNVMGA